MIIYRPMKEIAEELGIVRTESKFGNPVKYIMPATKTNLHEDLPVVETGNGIEIRTECVHVRLWEKDESESRMQIDIHGDHFKKSDKVLLDEAIKVLSNNCFD